MTVAADRQLVVVVPGLLTAPDEAATSRLPALERLLARSDRLTSGTAGFHATLFDLFGVAPPAGDLSVAAVTRVHDMGIVDQDWWLRADPVHLIPDRDRLILSDPADLALTRADADALVAELMQTYGPDGWLIKAPRTDRWYVRPAQPADIRTTPLAEAVGRDIHPFLPQGPDGRAWHTILNEFQILLHAARANADRERRNLPAVNSVWFWGGGRLPRITRCDWAAVWSVDPATRGFATLCGCAQRDLPAGFAAWQDAATPGRHLLVFTPSPRGDLAALEAGWFAPLHTALRSGDITRLEILDDAGAHFAIATRHTRRWWRRTRPLNTWAAATGAA
jgi:hypothetical protein